ncbi:LuxR C-terminal-related transcriptional regulator [Polaribacter sp. NJDZ03]|uniref:LuxR C-terminal-related transcriptional regulator n=1 Tax=Polaribacter sp. NJDZ03 TaxID=2855841 RepID=UPI001C4A1C6F|nr:LuxR C-terminal-related transcriptional regulator [Polaribacter sp. NJDZ03]
MKFKVLLIFLFFVVSTFSQSDVYYFKDASSSFSYKDIDKVEFKPLEKDILEEKSGATFWFKIPANKTYLSYIFRIISIRATNAKAYQNLREIKKLKNQRYSSFKFSREAPIYIKVSSNFSAYFPVELNTEEDAAFKEKVQLLIDGFYYGVAFLVILFSLNYFYFFRDNSFLYHAILLASLTFSFILSDGILHLFNVDEKYIQFLILLNFTVLAYFASKFANSFLLLDIYYPKVKNYTYTIGVGIILFVILFLIFKKNELYITLGVLTAILLFIYWFLGVLLFKENTHTKLFTFSYVIILFSGIDFFILKNFGISLFETNATNLKIGGFIQIIILSFAVLYREKDLRKYNSLMKKDIIKFSKEIEQLTVQEESIKINLDVLSFREREIFNLIVSSKSNKEIAAEVNISVNTVKFHVKNIYGKLNIKSRKEVLKI